MNLNRLNQAETKGYIMKKYHKIHGIFKRDTTKKGNPFIIGDYSLPEFEYLAEHLWSWHEKIDGTNIRVGWDGKDMAIGGRTDNAQIPVPLYVVLNDIFTPEILKGVFDVDDVDITLFGEGYGNKIQKGGGRYLSEKVSFILFDVLCNGTWLRQSDVANIAALIGIESAHWSGVGTIQEAIDRVKDGMLSSHAEDKTLIAEGLILRPTGGMLNRLGGRIITKIKHKDFK